MIQTAHNLYPFDVPILWHSYIKLLVTNNNLHVPDTESTDQTKSHQAVSFYAAPSLYEYCVPGIKKERNVSPRKRSLSQNMHELHVQSPTYLS